jgi:hypothetical protein
MRVVVCCGGDREHPRCYSNNYEESANSNSKSCSSFVSSFWHAVVEASRIEPFLGKNKCQTTIWASPQHNTHLVFITEKEEEEEEEEE